MQQNQRVKNGLLGSFSSTPFPDLHWFAAARAGIAFAGDDETLFSITLCPQSDPAPLLKNDIPASQTNTLILIGPEGAAAMRMRRAPQRAFEE